MSVINTDAFIFYNKLLESYSKENIEKGLDHSSNNLFVHSAINQAAANAENPFPLETEAYQTYFTMMKHHFLWRLGGPDRKVSRRRFLAHAIKLAELAVENPFEIELEPVIEIGADAISLEAMAEAEYAREDAAAIASGTYVPVIERPCVITGVVADDDDYIFVPEDDEEQDITFQSDKNIALAAKHIDVPENAAALVKKPGFFKRLINKFRKKANA